MCEADVSCSACNTGYCNSGNIAKMTDAQLSWSRDYILNVASTKNINLELGEQMTEDMTQDIDVEAVEANVEAVEVEATTEVEAEVTAETEAPVEAASTEDVAETAETVEAEVTEAEPELEVPAEAEAEAEVEVAVEVEVTEAEDTEIVAEVAEETMPELEAPMTGVSSDMYESVLSEKRDMEMQLDELKAASEAHTAEMAAIRAEHEAAMSGLRDLMLKIVPQETVDGRVLQAASGVIEGFNADAPLSEQDAITVAKVLALSKTVGDVAESANAGAVETVRKSRKEESANEREFAFRGLTLKNYKND